MSQTRRAAAKPAASVLAREKAFFQQLFEHSPAGIVILNNQDRVLDANPAFLALFCYTLDEVRDQTLNTLIVPEHQQEEASDYSLRALTHEPFQFETVRRRKDGSLVPVSVLATSILLNKKQVGIYGIYHDISLRKQAEEALAYEKEVAEVTLHAIGDAVIRTDAEGNVQYLNPVAEELTGWPLEDAAGKPLETVFAIINERTRRPAPNPVKRCLAEGRVVGLANHSLLLARGGHEVAVEDSAAPIISRSGKVIGVVLVFRDVSERRRAAEEMTYQAHHDLLTGLYNRHAFEQRITAILADRRHADKHHTMLYMDLDQFKVVNDTSGHQAGDVLLRQLAGLMRQELRETDMLARLGGDEFGLLLMNCPLKEAVKFAERLAARIHDVHFPWEEKVFNVGVSIGVVVLDRDTRTLSEVLSAADDACYAAKDRGRNQVYVYQRGDTDIRRRQEEMRWVTRLGEAIEAGRLELYHQEIHPTGICRQAPVRHYEVLVRLREETGELVLPGHFISAAERYGLIGKLDRWVVEQVFAGLAGRREAGEPLPDLVDINISGITISDPGFLQFIRGQLAHHELPASLICFELTETAAITNLAQTTNFIMAVRRLGCAVSLDDFGRGVSSFAYLKDLAVDYLKIDGTFVQGMQNDSVHHAIVEAIHGVANVMGIKTIAEYVENPETLARLNAIGIEYAQGFALHKPELWANRSS